jgi:LuxR family transcriptional regulator of csgAB operon
MKGRNALTASFFQDLWGVSCTCHERCSLGQPCKPKGECPLLVLWDFWGKDGNGLDIGPWLAACSPTSPTLIALYNVLPSKDIEKKAFDRGIRGVFFIHDPPSLVARGVEAILRGELWYSRETLDAGVIKKMLAARSPAREAVALSHREREVLTLLIRGAAYAEIGDRLCISPRTVKSHACKIYRKIGVSNRFQATEWASGNLWKGGTVQAA